MEKVSDMENKVKRKDGAEMVVNLTSQYSIMVAVWRTKRTNFPRRPSHENDPPGANAATEAVGETVTSSTAKALEGSIIT